MHSAWKLIEEVEELGGMTKAIEAGIPKMRIEEAAALRQAEYRFRQRRDRGCQRLSCRGGASDIPVLDIDDVAVRAAQIARLQQLKHERDPQLVEQALSRLENSAPFPGTATCWNAPSMLPARVPRWARFRLRSRKSGDVTRPSRKPFQASTRLALPMVKNSEKRERWSSNSSMKRGAGPAFLLPRWDKTVTIAAPR